MQECWQFKSDSKGRPAKICYGCPYYSGRRAKSIDEKVPCWDFLKCSHACQYKSPAPPQAPQKTGLKNRALLQSKSKLLYTADRLRKLSEEKNAHVKEGPPKNAGLNDTGYKLIAETLRLMLKTK